MTRYQWRNAMLLVATIFIFAVACVFVDNFFYGRHTIGDGALYALVFVQLGAGGAAAGLGACRISAARDWYER